MATLGELHRDLFPSAVARPGSLDGDREIGWVRVLKARVPAFDALDAGDLALVPLSALAIVAAGATEVAALAEGLARSGVSGVVLVAGDAGADVGSAAAGGSADALGQALERALADVDVPTIAIAGVDVVALERAIIGYLVNRRAELERQASLLEAQLQRLALGESDLPALVRAIGAFLGRAVALEGWRGDTLAVEAPADVVAAAAASAGYLTRIGTARARSIALRVSLPTASGPSGALLLLGEHPVGELERVVAERIAGLVALEIARDEAVRRARDDSRRPETLPPDGPGWVVLVARQIGPGDDAGPAERERLRREIRRLAPARRLALRGDVGSIDLRLVASCPPDDPLGLIIAGRIAAFIGRPVAVSRTFVAPHDRATAEAAARSALEAGEVLPGPPAVLRADRSPVYRLLGNLHNLPDGLRLSRALLAPLLSGRPAAERVRLATLRSVLDHGSLLAVAAELGVHRNTVAYRVRRLEALGGWDLADPELRLALGVALRIVQSVQD
ncbi:MAG: PucR family transcriptional regulator [Candidatus Limnocylindrales bacterium]